jgi:hypothetical protein
VLLSTVLASFGARPVRAAAAPTNFATVEPLVSDGIEAYNRGDYLSAIVQLRWAQALSSDDSAITLYLGLAFLKKGLLLWST